MYHVNSWGLLEIKRFEVVVSLVIRDKGCEVRNLVYIEYIDRVK